MAGHRKWETLRARLRERPDYDANRAAAESEFNRLDEAWGATLAAIRKARQVSQVELARRLGVTQPQISRLENQADLHLSTLERYLDGIGAHVAIHVSFEDGTRFELKLADLAGVAEPSECELVEV